MPCKVFARLYHTGLMKTLRRLKVRFHVCGMWYANGRCLFLLPSCDGTSNSWLTLWHSHSYKSVHGLIHLPHSLLRSQIQTYGSTTVCLHAFPIFVAFTYRIQRMWNLSFTVVKPVLTELRAPVPKVIHSDYFVGESFVDVAHKVANNCRAKVASVERLGDIGWTWKRKWWENFVLSKSGLILIKCVAEAYIVKISVCMPKLIWHVSTSNISNVGHLK